MKRFLLPVVMMFVLVSDSVYADFVNLPFVTEEQQLIPRFLLLVLVFMTAYVNQPFAITYGFIFGLLYDINYTDLLGVYMFGFAGICYLSSKAFKVLQTNALVVIFIALLAVCVLEFYQYGVQMLIRPEIMPFHQFVLGRLLPTLALNAVGGLLLIYPFKWFFTSLKKELRNE
ncbi:rod shape-determining protein MreD [Bacillus haynesii]|uniref:Rod shape-determining protein MreD n=1 Tax=Bacillus haynesii TaxID=1925021 RepID=A0ABX3I0X3_9BACI|nr:rod shape-determining protein MreD [Bacillus haynesii]EWH23478.1 rod shape-determining protein MreD [Bacillus haynesii]MCI4128518.1 rod shape-determining protein MreD [Bacillus haynesii]MCY7993149.1 rod shape-determining protein MreD [Bacillus haynesii]OMI25315.1 rod shape-determining protein MreD [Bacillus haynesii]